MRWIAGLVAAIALGCGSAAAQSTPNPVMEHYRAYNAAMQAGDFAAAETAAAAAVEASEARDGDGGNTPVLVMNLAMVRVTAGQFEQAVAPAQRAVAFAEQGAEGLDLALARLVLGQAELSRGGRGPAERLQALLLEMRAAGGHESQVYLAASRLGQWALTERLYRHSVDAWTVAIDMTTQGDRNGAVARGNALIGRGTARLFADNMGFSTGSTGSNIVQSPEGLAELDYAEALRTLRPLLITAAGGDTRLTEAQQLYANALAWSTALRAKLRSLGWEDPAPLQGGGGFVIGTSSLAPLCPLTLDAPEPAYPGSAISEFGAGAVVVRIVTDDRGEIVERGVIATAGGVGFRNSVERVLPRWRYELAEGAMQPCSGASVRFIPYLFYIGF